MIHPLGVLALVFAKKVVGYKTYQAVVRYGIPRMYRRLLEQNKALMPSEAQGVVKDAIRISFRSPSHMLRVLREAEVLDFLDRVTHASTSRLPPFMKDIMNSVWNFSKRL